MKSTLRKEILTETYEDVQKLIFEGAWKFWNLYGGDIRDLIAQANLIFIEAFDSYNPNRGALLTTWIAFKVKKGLIDYLKNGNVYKSKHTSIDDEFIRTYPASKNENFSVMELLDEMGQDSHVVLQLFFEIPKDVMVNILNSKKKSDHVRSAIRRRLRNRLRQMGWTMKRTKKAFEQIKSVTNY